MKNPWVGREKCEKAGGMGVGKKRRKGYAYMFLFSVPERKTSERRGEKDKKAMFKAQKGRFGEEKEGKTGQTFNDWEDKS